ncbi:hypothetical protein ACYSUW_13270 [Pseudomonas frederiksbergensis]
MIYEQMQAELKELLGLVRQDGEYTAAIRYGAVQPDEATHRAHQMRAVRIDELSRKYGAL